MRKIILLAGLVAGGVALSATAFANGSLFLLLLGGSGGNTEPPPVTEESNKWLLFLPAILAGSQGQTPVVTGPSFNDTGIITAVGDTGAEDADYGRDSDPATNSDADGHAGFSFTKLDNNGGALPASATTWNCVHDNVGGETWSLHKGEVNMSGLQGIVDAANNTILCGESGWRLPTVKELIGIVDYHKASGPMIESTFFVDILAGWYWTSTDHTEPGSDEKWGVDFSNGQAGPLSTTDVPADKQRVLLVR